MSTTHKLSDTHEAIITWDSGSWELSNVDARDEYEGAALQAMRPPADGLAPDAEWGGDDEACLRVAAAGEQAMQDLHQAKYPGATPPNVSIMVNRIVA